MNNFDTLLARFAISPWDFAILIFLITVSFFYTLLFINRGKVIPLLVATYMAFVLVHFAPFLDLALAEQIKFSELYQLRLLAFAVLFVIILFVLSRVIFQSPVGAETFGVIPSFLLSVAQTGFLVAVFVSFLPPEITKQFSSLSSAVFVGSEALFYWAAAPIILLLILGKKANREIG